MRDLRRVREVSEVRFTVSQVYGMVALGLLSLCLTGGAGYYFGMHQQPEIAGKLAQDPVAQPLVLPGGESESIAQLMAIAREDQNSKAPIVLDYHTLLPERVPKKAKPKAVAISNGPSSDPLEMDPKKNVTEVQGSDLKPEEVIQKVDSKSVEDNKVPKAEVKSGRYTLQVSSFQSEEQAEVLIAELKRKGFDAYRVEALVNSMTWHRVRVGRFDVRGGAEAEIERLAVVRSDLRPMVTVR